MKQNNLAAPKDLNLSDSATGAKRSQSLVDEYK